MDTYNRVNYQIGQCRIAVDENMTRAYYESLPNISSNCSCDNCIYFQNIVSKKNIRLFKILTKMGVDLTKQAKTTPDSIMYLGESEKFNKLYISECIVYGSLGKTQRKKQIAHDNLEFVEFFEPEEDSYTQFSIAQINEDVVKFSFQIECERKRK